MKNNNQPKTVQGQHKSIKQIWGKPLLLALLTMLGLLAALLGIGVWHWLSWVALCIPLLLLCQYLYWGKKEKKQ